MALVGLQPAETVERHQGRGRAVAGGVLEAAYASGLANLATALGPHPVGNGHLPGWTLVLLVLRRARTSPTHRQPSRSRWSRAASPATPGCAPYWPGPPYPPTALAAVAPHPGAYRQSCTPLRTACPPPSCGATRNEPDGNPCQTRTVRAAGAATGRPEPAKSRPTPPPQGDDCLNRTNSHTSSSGW